MGKQSLAPGTEQRTFGVWYGAIMCCLVLVCLIGLSGCEDETAGNVKVEATKIENSGTIKAGKGSGAGTNDVVYDGSVELKIIPPTLSLAQQAQSDGSIINEGTIQAGDGSYGGGVELSADQIENTATGSIVSGSGMGRVTIRSDGAVASQGTIALSSTQELSPSITSEYPGTDDLSPLLTIVASDIDLSGSDTTVSGEARITATNADSRLQGVAGGINLSGSATRIDADTLGISAGPGMTINLDNMAPGALNVDTVTLAAGTGGSISMQHATTIISATNVTLAADTIETGGANLPDIVGSNVERLPAQELSYVSFGIPVSLTTTPGQATSTTVTLYNDGPTQQTYTFAVDIDQAGWTVTGLPATQVINGFAQANLPLVIQSPGTSMATQRAIITLTAQATGHPTLVTSTWVGVTARAPYAIYVPMVTTP